MKDYTKQADSTQGTVCLYNLDVENNGADERMALKAAASWEGAGVKVRGAGGCQSTMLDMCILTILCTCCFSFATHNSCGLFTGRHQAST